MSNFRGTPRRKRGRPKKIAAEYREATEVVELTLLDFCIPECQLGPSVKVPMITCGLCDQWFHIRCLGLPEGGPRFIRGLYFCQDCLGALKELRRLLRPQRQQKARFEAVEALVDALDVEHLLLRERLDRMKPASTDLFTRTTDGRVVDASYVALLRENAELKRQLVNVLPTADKSQEQPRTEVMQLAENKHELTAVKMDGVKTTDILLTGFDVNKAQDIRHKPKKRKLLSVSASRRQHVTDDNYLYCDDCDKLHLNDCPVHGPAKRIFDSIVSEADPSKAESSLPLGLVFAASAIPGGNRGVWSDIDIPKGTMFGPYKGKIVSLESLESLACERGWLILREKNLSHYVDASEAGNSNWLSFVGFSPTEHQCNLYALQYRGHIFYRATKNITKGMELLLSGVNDHGFTSLARQGSLQNPLVISQSCVDNVATYSSKRLSASTSVTTSRPRMHVTPQVPEETGAVVCSPKTTEPFAAAPAIPLACHMCHLNLATEEQLAAHCEEVHGMEQFHRCKQCPLTFRTYYHMCHHILNVHGVNVNVSVLCECCHKSFPNHSELLLHWPLCPFARGTENGTFSAWQDQQGSLKKAQNVVSKPASSFIRDIQDTEIMCRMCMQPFSDRQMLNSHLTSYHRIGPSAQDSFAVVKENALVPMPTSVIYDQVITGLKACGECNTNFVSDADAVNHFTLVHGMSSFALASQNPALSNRVATPPAPSSRTVSYRLPAPSTVGSARTVPPSTIAPWTLTPNNRYRCNICSIMCATETDIDKHQQFVHGVLRQYPESPLVDSVQTFACVQCRREFKSKIGLNVHMNSHRQKKVQLQSRSIIQPT